MKKKLLLLFAVLATAINVSAENYILYTSSDGKVVTPYKTNVFGAKIVSNTYEDGLGKIVFDGEVTRIGNSAFCYCENLTSVEIPNSVTKIGDSAFYNCFNLSTIDVPDFVTSIGYTAFAQCFSLSSIKIGNSVSTIYDYAFSYCTSLNSVQLPNSVTKVGCGAFMDCANLNSVLIGNSVTELSSSVFSSCSNLIEITSLNSNPPIVGPTPFFEVPTTTCVLKVPAQSVDDYKVAEGWNEFQNIVGLTDEEIGQINGIQTVSVDEMNCLNGKTFNISGLRVGNTYKGIVVKDGRKFLKK